MAADTYRDHPARVDTELTIKRLPDGGFLIIGPYNYPGQMMSFNFASTTIDEGLKYIKKQLTK